MSEEDQKTGAEEQQMDNALRQIAGQLRYSLGNIHSALERLAPAEARDGDQGVDRNAAVLCQSYYRILRLTDNLSEASELSGPSRSRPRNDDIVAVCRDVAVRAEGLAELAGLELVFRADREAQIISVDPRRIRQLLLNLLSNAFKYTPKGGTVTLGVSVNRDRVNLIVRDTGPGIPEGAMDTLYERYRHPPLLDGLPHGLGLGLPICRKIAEEHGGSMLVASKAGEGTTVTVSLPNRREKVTRLHSYTPDPGGYTVDASGGFNPLLVGLADALPKEAFTQKYLD